MTAWVIDASVAAKWLLPEDGSDQASALLGDDLLVRQGRSLQPTPKALELWPEIRATLERLQTTLAPRVFAPASAQHSFVLTMADATAAELMVGLVTTLSQQAPGVSLRTLPLTTRDPRRLLEDGQVDLAIGHFPAVLTDLTARAQAGARLGLKRGTEHGASQAVAGGVVLARREAVPGGGFEHVAGFDQAQAQFGDIGGDAGDAGEDGGIGRHLFARLAADAALPAAGHAFAQVAEDAAEDRLQAQRRHLRLGDAYDFRRAGLGRGLSQ